MGVPPSGRAGAGRRGVAARPGIGSLRRPRARPGAGSRARPARRPDAGRPGAPGRRAGRRPPAGRTPVVPLGPKPRLGRSLPYLPRFLPLAANSAGDGRPSIARRGDERASRLAHRPPWPPARRFVHGRDRGAGGARPPPRRPAGGGEAKRPSPAGVRGSRATGRDRREAAGDRRSKPPPRARSRRAGRTARRRAAPGADAGGVKTPLVPAAPRLGCAGPPASCRPRSTGPPGRCRSSASGAGGRWGTS